MKDEYIIISKTNIQKSIYEITIEQKNILKQLRQLYNSLKSSNKYFEYKDNMLRYFTALTNEKRVLEKILSQSTPLIPIIEDAFDSGRKLSNKSQLYTPDFYWTKEDYIQNLKINI